MDECWIDVTGSAIMGTGEEIAEEIRQAVKDDAFSEMPCFRSSSTSSNISVDLPQRRIPVTIFTRSLS